ncbi:hypothetical protein IX38_21445 [Chryseobacterium luteum]|uniref:Uncharacterized protein n=1 Tax=Chryseobacterium luteum TaxID=421531 RepID=A0A085YY29_9FLAO|nr:hypothetical protein IX38_21445 [Chryseobacterium luteum]
MDAILKKLNSQKNIQFSIDKPNPKSKQKHCLVSIYQTADYIIYYPLYLEDLKLPITVGRVSGGNILIYSKKDKHYLALSYTAGEYIHRKDKKYMKLKFNFKRWDLINSQSVLLDNSLKPIKYIFFPSELHNVTSEIKDITMTVQDYYNNKAYDVTLNTSFYNIPLNQLFSNFYLKNEEEYLSEPVEDADFFMFLKDKKICRCKQSK